VLSKHQLEQLFLLNERTRNDRSVAHMRNYGFY